MREEAAGVLRSCWVAALRVGRAGEAGPERKDKSTPPSVPRGAVQLCLELARVGTGEAGYASYLAELAGVIDGLLGSWPGGKTPGRADDDFVADVARCAEQLLAGLKSHVARLGNVGEEHVYGALEHVMDLPGRYFTFSTPAIRATWDAELAPVYTSASLE